MMELMEVREEFLRKLKRGVEDVARHTPQDSEAWKSIAALWSQFCLLLHDPPTTLLSGEFIVNGVPLVPERTPCEDGHHYNAIEVEETITKQGYVTDTIAASGDQRSTETTVRDILLYCERCGDTKLLKHEPVKYIHPEGKEPCSSD